MTVEEFVARHGGKPAKLRHVWLLPDPARVRPPGPLLFEPPPDRLQRLKLQLEYHKPTNRLRPALRQLGPPARHQRPSPDAARAPPDWSCPSVPQSLLPYRGSRPSRTIL